MKKLLLILPAVCLMASCGAGKNKKTQPEADANIPTYTITYDGVAPASFNASGEPFTMEGYKVVADESNVTKYVIKDMQDNTVITRDENIMTVVSPVFKTEEGVSVGMPIAEAVKLTGEWMFADYVQDPNSFEIYKDEDESNIALVLSASDLKDASMLTKFRANPKTLKLEDFKPETKITSIKIYQLI